MIPKGNPAAADALAAFQESAKNGAWEKAFDAMSTVMESPSDAMIRRPDGFYLSTRSQVLQMLVGLPVAGREAYRLFNDATARRMLGEADAPAGSNSNPISRLQTLFDRYFITSVGDQIADRLGDAKFESGDFLGAANCWGAILSDYPDTSLSSARLATKRAVALARANRWIDLQAAISQIREKYADQPIRLGGRDQTIAEVIDALPSQNISSSVTQTHDESSSPSLSLLPAAGSEPSWQTMFLDNSVQDQIQRMSKSLNSAYASSDPSTIVPGAAVSGDRLYMNWLGIGVAIDTSSGKILWRTAPFTTAPSRIQQLLLGFNASESMVSLSPTGDRVVMSNGSPQSRAVDVNAAAVGVVVARAGAAPARMHVSVAPGSGVIACYTSKDGKLLWGSDATAALQTWNILGQAPMSSSDDSIYVAATQVVTQSTELDLLSIGLSDGDVRWKLNLGSTPISLNIRGMSGMNKPILRRSGDMLYVLTGSGALVAVNLSARRIEWAFTYDTPSYLNNSSTRTISSSSRQLPASLQLSGSLLYFKEKGSNMMYAVDTSGPTLLWTRRVDDDAAIIGSEGANLYLFNDNVSGIDLNSLEMQWSTWIPQAARVGRPLVIGSRAYIYQLGALYAVDLHNGSRSKFDSYDQWGFGGTVLRANGKIISVSNRMVTAYPIPGEANGQN